MRWHLIAALALLGADAEAASFIPLGNLDGSAADSKAYGISADGSMVVGETSMDGYIRAFAWTTGSGMVDIGQSAEHLGARAVSADGTVIAGSFDFSTAAAWHSAGGQFAALPGTGGIFSIGSSISDDGSLIVGRHGEGAVYWQNGGTLTLLPTLPGSVGGNMAIGVSPDGSTIVGYSRDPDGNSQAVQWTTGGTVEGLGGLDNNQCSDARAASADGSVIVGVLCGTSTQEHSYRWTDATGMVGLGTAVHGASTWYGGAFDVSADGHVVVGYSARYGDEEAYVWTAEAGMRSLLDILVAAGVGNLDGWDLITATAVSADGLTVAGWGINPAGTDEAYLAVLPAEVVPVPAAAWLLASALGALGWAGRRRSRSR